MATVVELLTEGVERLRAAGSESARLDAELLLGQALNADRTSLLAYPEALVGDGAAAEFRRSVARRELGEPVAYIRGLKEFYGLALSVDDRALIPRPETERLVELAEEEVIERLVGMPRPNAASRLEIVDVGTGSGAIALALAASLRRRGMLDEISILATDVSDGALQLARENAVSHALADHVSFVSADLVPDRAGQHWDLVLANLPYMRTAAVPELPVATTYEPALALDGGVDGLEVIGRLLDRLPSILGFGGVALIEIGGDQGTEIAQTVDRRLPGWRCQVEVDLGGLPRVARVERPGS